jgi:hypothetical protein
MMHERFEAVNVIWPVFSNLYAFITRTHRFLPASTVLTWANGPGRSKAGGSVRVCRCLSGAYPASRGRNPSSTNATTKSAT